MRMWKVQYAYGPEIGLPSVHRTEAAAKGDVAHLLGNWIVKNLASTIRNLERESELRHPEFVMDGKAVAHQIIDLLNAGEVWQAYDVWQEFYDKYEFEMDVPLFVMIGTVVIESNQAEGPTRRGRPMFRRTERPPMEEYQAMHKGDVPIMFGYRENLEMNMVMLQLVHRVREKLKAEGRGHMPESEFDEKFSEAMHRAEAEVRAGQKYEPEDLLILVEKALKQTFGLSGRQHSHGAVLRRFS
jgi:hypothetical protein